MKFINWLENEHDPTVASAEVKRTNLQPQVDSEEIHTKEKEDHDKVMALDAELEQLDSKISGSDSPRLNKFRELWNELKLKWDEIKVSDPKQPDDGGLGRETGDQNYLRNMQRYPNMIPARDQGPNGPGIFGQS